jgi:hypothetical protein
LDLVSAGRQAMPTALRPPQGPGHTRATALPGPPQHLLQEVQPLAHARRAGCLHRYGGKAAEPLTAGSVGSADRAAVLGSEGRRPRKMECQAYKDPSRSATIATTESCAINLGHTPEFLQGLTGVPPSGGRPGTDGGMEKAECRMQKEEGESVLTRAANPWAHGIHPRKPPECCRGQAVADGKAGPPSPCPSGSWVAHATGDPDHRDQPPPLTRKVALARGCGLRLSVRAWPKFSWSMMT